LKKNKISKNWINRQKRDIYVRKSKVEGYRSRAVYKLMELDQKFKIFRNGISLVDLGSAPGSWTQYVLKKVKNAKILSIDLKEINKIENNFHIKGDFTEPKLQEEIKEYFNNKVDIVLSDMAANTTGNKYLDSLRTGELTLEAINFSKNILKKEGKFISKVFMGSLFNEIIVYARKSFKDVKVFKPLSSRKNSKENYIICTKY
tara:strand:+ start:624 stop:1232 length:609 start_codon:yes stop_codon:yes gene_type:complete